MRHRGKRVAVVAMAGGSLEQTAYVAGSRKRDFKSGRNAAAAAARAMMLVAHSSIRSARPHVSVRCRPQVGAASSVNRAVRCGMKRQSAWSGVGGGGGVGGGVHRCIGMVVRWKVRKSDGGDSWRGCGGDDAGASAVIFQNGGTGATAGVQHAPRGPPAHPPQSVLDGPKQCRKCKTGSRLCWLPERPPHGHMTHRALWHSVAPVLRQRILIGRFDLIIWRRV